MTHRNLLSSKLSDELSVLETSQCTLGRVNPDFKHNFSYFAFLVGRRSSTTVQQRARMPQTNGSDWLSEERERTTCKSHKTGVPPCRFLLKEGFTFLLFVCIVPSKHLNMWFICSTLMLNKENFAILCILHTFPQLIQVEISQCSICHNNLIKSILFILLLSYLYSTI